MALKRCKECGGQVSSDAAICPACGKPQKRQPIGCGGGLVLLVLLMVLGATIRSAMDTSTPTAAAVKTTKAKKAEKETPEQTAQKMKENALDTAAYMTARALKESARNPARFSLEEVLAMDATDSACITARSENGFGGLNVVKVVFRAGSNPPIRTSEDTGFSRAWNAGCANQTGRDITRLVQVMLDRR